METKLCSKCGIEKAMAEYHKDRTKKDGLASSCVSCYKEYYRISYERNKEKRLSKQKKYYEENKEEINKKNKHRYHINFDREKNRRRESRKKWAAKNQEKIKNYYDKNRDKLLEYKKNWLTSNKEKVKNSRNRMINKMSDGYVNKLIYTSYNIPYNEIDSELINNKRRELKFKRQLKQLKQLKNQQDETK